MNYEVKDGKLVITVDVGAANCAAAPPSSTGKTMMVGSSAGSVAINSPKGWELKFSLNVYGKKTGG